mgnify:CR=1 FL=1
MQGDLFLFFMEIDTANRDNKFDEDLYTKLVDKMRKWCKEYYLDSINKNEIDDEQYDMLYKILEKFESENPTLISEFSPTQYVGYKTDQDILDNIKYPLLDDKTREKNNIQTRKDKLVQQAKKKSSAPTDSGSLYCLFCDDIVSTQYNICDFCGHEIFSQTNRDDSSIKPTKKVDFIIKKRNIDQLLKDFYSKYGQQPLDDAKLQTIKSNYGNNYDQLLTDL